MLAETESQLLFAVEVGYIDADDVEKVRSTAAEIRRMIAAILRKLRS